ncbi:MAG: hypothetical protein JST73_13295 [Actinobacteria bacterium]|nr:hypothetical protein [Actinomycetota bacterium]
MFHSRAERRLIGIGDRLRSLREEEAICREQLLHVASEADDARIRALVSDSPADRHEHRGARRAAETLAERHRRVLVKIGELEARQDELLDELADRRN